MLSLEATNQKIQVVTTGTAGIDVLSTYVDLSAGTVTPGNQPEEITTATTTDVVDPPAASTSRRIKAIFIANVHASSSNTVTIQWTNGTVTIHLESVTLLAGERIAIREGVPTRVIDAAGMEKVAPLAVGQYT